MKTFFWTAYGIFEKIPSYLKFLMKKLASSLLLCICFSVAWCQKFHKSNLIDEIRTPADVDSFLKVHVSSLYPITCKQPVKFLPKLEDVYHYFYDSLGIVPFAKYDFDKDGRMDILINGLWRSRAAAMVILDKENGRFESHPFVIRNSRGLNMPFVKWDSSGSVSMLDYYEVQVDTLMNRINLRKLMDEYKTGYLKRVRCVYKFGNFIEENPHPAPLHLSVIDFEKGGIFREYYNHYHIRIFKNRKAFLAVGTGNEKLSGPQEYGTYESRLSRKQYKTLQRLAAYINLGKLKNMYDVDAADAAWAVLKIKFTKNESKKIFDRALEGTFGLKVLYRFFDQLYKDLNWKKADVKDLGVQWDTI